MWWVGGGGGGGWVYSEKTNTALALALAFAFPELVNSNFAVIKDLKAPVMGDGGPVSGVIKKQYAMTFPS